MDTFIWKYQPLVKYPLLSEESSYLYFNPTALRMA